VLLSILIIYSWCYIFAKFLYLQFQENLFVLRNPDNYDYHCSLLTRVLAEKDSVTYGVNYKSALNKLDNSMFVMVNCHRI